jgi:hypothetical protein
LKRKHLAAILTALALALASCGGDDTPEDSSPAAGATSPSEQPEKPQTESEQGSPDRSASQKAKNGDGGSSVEEAKRAADAERAAAPGQGDSGGGAGKPKADPPKSPEELIAALSPAERRRLHKDLYEQGKNSCYDYGPGNLKKAYNLLGSDPATIARQYARAYEAATPSLILPFQQGCLAGFRKFERNPPKD